MSPFGSLFIVILSLVALLGCREDVPDPTSPEPTPALELATAQAFVLKQVDNGVFHTCGLTSNQKAYCWGSNRSGELGDGSETGRHRPVAVSGGHDFRQVSAGQFHSCGVTLDNQAHCWGSNSAGQLGDGTVTSRSVPVPVAGGLRFLQVEASVGLHTCGVSYPDRRVYCWGANAIGQGGDGMSERHMTPFPIASTRRFRHVSGGSGHTCGVTTLNEVLCWGNNESGQVGDGSTAHRRRFPSFVASGQSFKQVTAGSNHSCAVTTANKAFCWGAGGEGQIGDRTTNTRLAPRAVAGGHSFERVTGGRFHTCGERTDNRAYCWGSNRDGQLGDGTTFDRLRPVAVSGGHAFAQLSAGGFHTCGVASGDGRAYCWGNGLFGQRGDGTTANRRTPVAVAEPM